MNQPRATSSETFRERMTTRALNSLERATNFSEMTAARKCMASLALAGSMIVSGATAASVENINDNYAEAMENSATVDVRLAPKSTSGQDTAYVVMAGFSNYNSNILADTVGPALQGVSDGEVWSVSYNNAHLDYEGIAKTVAENAQARQLDDVKLFGHSAGGIIAVRVTEELQKLGVHVSVVVLNSTPDGIEGLRPDKQHDIEAYASILAEIPGLPYFDPARYIGEMAIRSENLKTQEGFIDAHRGVTELIQNEYTPGTWLLIDQLTAIGQANLEVRLASIAENAQPGEKPLIIELGTGDPIPDIPAPKDGGYDTFVNDDYSRNQFAKYTDNVGLSYLSYDIPGAVHMHPEQSKEAYAYVLAKASSEIRAAMRGDESDKV